MGTPELVGTGVGAVAAAVGVLGGVVLVVTRHLDPVSAAIIGGLALGAAEAGVVVGRRRWVRSVGPGTAWGRVAVVGAAMLGGLVVAVVVDPSGHPSRAGLVAGLGAVGALVVVVTMTAARPWAGPDPRNTGTGEGFPESTG